MTRPRGLGGPIVADVRGQDVRTDRDGRATVVDRLALTLDIDPRTGVVLAASPAPSAPPVPGLDALVGAGVRSGFSRLVAATLPGDAARRSLLYSALDDLGAALLVSGFALLANGAIPADPARGEEKARAQANICTGWATGSGLLDSLRRDGVAATPIGPPAPVIDGGDPDGWHPMAVLATDTVRRRRRLDVAPSGAAGLDVHSHFRDSYAGADTEMVMHEYLVTAGVDGDGRLARVLVEPRVLPWTECPGAVASAQRLVGVTIDDVATRARRDLKGPTTCTHLTSTLRCLADVAALAPGPPG